MFNYRLVVAYDGTSYHGWQLQTSHVTVTQQLQETFECVFACRAIITGASRTDAGVHACAQVALCRTSLDLQPSRLLWAWNNKLPADIVIRELERCDEGFNPRKNVLRKTYWYHFFVERPLPFYERYGWYLGRRPCEDVLRASLSLFVGCHDFRSFCTGEPVGQGTTRFIESTALEYNERLGAHRIVICGPSFVRYMIRRIVGACITVACRRHFTLEYLRGVFEARNPKHTLPTAPARGLMLAKIEYQRDSTKS